MSTLRRPSTPPETKSHYREAEDTSEELSAEKELQGNVLKKQILKELNELKRASDSISISTGNVKTTKELKEDTQFIDKFHNQIRELSKQVKTASPSELETIVISLQKLHDSLEDKIKLEIIEDHPDILAQKKANLIERSQTMLNEIFTRFTKKTLQEESNGLIDELEKVASNIYVRSKNPELTEAEIDTMTQTLASITDIISNPSFSHFNQQFNKINKTIIEIQERKKESKEPENSNKLLEVMRNKKAELLNQLMSHPKQIQKILEEAERVLSDIRKEAKLDKPQARKSELVRMKAVKSNISILNHSIFPLQPADNKLSANTKRYSLPEVEIAKSKKLGKR